MRTTLTTVFLLILTTGGCAKNMAASAEFPPRTTLKVSTTRCEGEECICRPLDSDDRQNEKGIPAGHKRFEFRLPRSVSSIWVEIEGKGVYYKGPQTVLPSCFYVDLKPGLHFLTVHSSTAKTARDLQTGLTIWEYGPKVRDNWYRSFHYVCGSGASACTREEMEIWSRFQAKLPRGVLDPCGSVMVRGVRYSGRRVHKTAQEYLDLTVRFRLKVYDFQPYRVPMSRDCMAPRKNQ